MIIAGIIGAVATLVTAATGLIVALKAHDKIDNHVQSTQPNVEVKKP